MKRTATTPGIEPKAERRHMTARECERMEQLEETKRWISANALRKLRKAWRH